jgi:hypothetical protein
MGNVSAFIPGSKINRKGTQPKYWVKGGHAAPGEQLASLLQPKSKPLERVSFNRLIFLLLHLEY